jgi:hypothetical protein
MEKRNNEKALKYYNKIVSEDNEAFSVTEVPEELKEEPAVIIAQKIYVAFYDTPKFKILGQTGQSDYKGITKKRIKLQDATAVKEFSEFYFQGSDVIGIEIIKSDGRVVEVDILNAVKVEKDVPSFYQDSYHSEIFYKIAIPNLEVGDILDYFKVFSEKTKGTIKLSSIISSEYPILNNQYVFDVNKTWDFYHRISNYEDKSSLRYTDGGYNGNGEWRKGIRRFSFKGATNPAKIERWDYQYLTEPVLKINASFNGQISRQFTRLKLGEIISGVTNSVKGKDGFSKIKKMLSELNLTSKKDNEKADLIYRAMRQNFLNEVFTQASELNNKITEAKEMSYVEMNDPFFMVAFAYALKKYDISSEVVVTTPRANGKVNHTILFDELYFLVYIPSIEKYFFPVSSYSLGGEMHRAFFGASLQKKDYIAISKGSYGALLSRRFEDSDAKDHQSITSVNISINENNELDFSNMVNLKGAYKSYFRSDLLQGSEYLLADQVLNPKVVKTILNDLSEERKKEVEKFLKDDFEFETLDEFTISQYGTTLDQPEIEYDYNFSTDKYLNKVGPNLVLDIGQLISGQVQLSEEEINTRTKPINIDFAKTIVNNITLELPKNFKVEGLDQLKMNVDNEQGSFISEVNLEDDYLNIITTKTYKQQNIEVDNWPNLVAMLEAAYNFSQKKVVLKPIE